MMTISRREKEKRKKRYLKAKERLEQEDNELEEGVPADPCKYLMWMDDDEEAEGCPLAILVRESTPAQRKNSAVHMEKLEQAAEKKGYRIVYKAKHIGWAGDSRWIRPHAKKVIKAGAEKVLMESTDRYVRHPGAYRERKNWHFQPRENEFVELTKNTMGLKLLTNYPPNMPYNEIHGKQTKRGQSSCKSGNPGRPRNTYSGYRKEQKRVVGS